MSIKTRFSCQSCGYQTPKWLGKCPDCNAWNSFIEENTSKALEQREKTGFFTLTSDEPILLDKISLESTPRHQTTITELDRALGGGIVPGSLILLGGDPGIGKSTLVLQALSRLAQSGTSVLYVTGEESREQIKMRAQRLNVSGDILVVAENSLDKILSHVEKTKPQILVIDSIQTVFLPHLESAPGSLSQVRECAGKILYFSKSSGTATFLVGHVTKEGAIAGPRILEHMVDAVLYFEGENSGQFRILRTIKNRYGSTNEIGVFEMTSQGLKDIANPSQIFLRERRSEVSGSVVTSTMEGSRPILTEIQALVSSSSLANPRRTAIGVDNNRVALIIAVLEKIAGLNLYNQDIYVNAAGGLKVFEPACDLAILLALVSSFKNRPLSGHCVVLGEVGLTGELRSVSQMENRVQEAIRLGYKSIIVPKTNKPNWGKTTGVEIMACETVNQVLEIL
jgi:DNA repair protein RadA/Sms